MESKEVRGHNRANSTRKKQSQNSKPHLLTADERKLMEACKIGDLDGVYQEFWKKANINCQDPATGATPLHLACQKGNTSVVSVLIELGADVQIKDDYGVSALHWAANLPSPKVVQTLIEKCGLNISQLSTQDDYGSTPLHFASVRNNPDTVHMLVKSGSLTSIQNNDLKKPSEVTDNAQIKDFLLSNEAKAENRQIHEKIERKVKKKDKKPTIATNRRLTKGKVQPSKKLKGFISRV